MQNCEICWYSASFADTGTEQQYQKLLAQVFKTSVFGKWGSLSVASFATAATILSTYVWSIRNLSTPGTLEQNIVALPLLILCLLQQWRIRFGNLVVSSDLDRCQAWAEKWYWLVTFTEAALAYINHTLPQFQGCHANRFRCPDSFSSTIFVCRTFFVDVAFIFHLTPTTSFHRLAAITMLGLLIRILGSLIYSTDHYTSMWSFACVLVGKFVFLGCRYQRLISGRKKHMLDLHISSLHAELQQLMDGMVPRAFAGRARTEDFVADACDHATVLFCSFSHGQAADADPLATFDLLNRVYRAFDSLLAQHRAVKVLPRRGRLPNAPGRVLDASAAACPRRRMDREGECEQQWGGGERGVCLAGDQRRRSIRRVLL